MLKKMDKRKEIKFWSMRYYDIFFIGMLTILKVAMDNN
jgi:hypothetical protein